MTCIDGRKRFPPSSALHGDHLSLAVRMVLAHVRYARGLRWWLVVSARVVMAVTRRDDAGPMRACAPSANGSPTR
jgi:hypothetical protein